jgi:hypothetical protein
VNAVFETRRLARLLAQQMDGRKLFVGTSTTVVDAVLRKIIDVLPS